jgi:hypothetical protein
MREIPLADELRFLAAQADAQASGADRAEDKRFLLQLAAQLFDLAGCGGIAYASWIIGGENLSPQVALRRVAAELRVEADRLQPALIGRAA